MEHQDNQLTQLPALICQKTPNDEREKKEGWADELKKDEWKEKEGWTDELKKDEWKEKEWEIIEQNERIQDELKFKRYEFDYEERQMMGGHTEEWNLYKKTLDTYNAQLKCEHTNRKVEKLSATDHKITCSDCGLDIILHNLNNM